MRARIALALLAIVFVVAGCESSAAPAPVTVTPVEVLPSGTQPVTSAPDPVSTDCDPEASLRPGPLPSPGAMPLKDIATKSPCVIMQLILQRPCARIGGCAFANNSEPHT